MRAYRDGAGLDQGRPPGQMEEDRIVTISMYEASVGVFVPFLRNLSGLMDQAASHAEARKIEPSILLNMRLYPNMYNLAQQVAEANRHAVIACALLAGREPQVPADIKLELSDLKSRIAAAIDFVESLPRAEIDAAAEREVTFRFRSGLERKFSGRSLL